MKHLKICLLQQLSNKVCISSRKRKNLYELLNASFQSVRRLFVFGYAVTAGAENNEACIKYSKMYFVPRVKINNHNLLIEEETFMINQLMT